MSLLMLELLTNRPRDKRNAAPYSLPDGSWRLGIQRRKARGGQGRAKVSLGPVMLDPSTPFGRFRGGPPTGRAASGRLPPL
jgi:hypothetical protein